MEAGAQRPDSVGPPPRGRLCRHSPPPLPPGFNILPQPCPLSTPTPQAGAGVGRLCLDGGAGVGEAGLLGELRGFEKEASLFQAKSGVTLAHILEALHSSRQAWCSEADVREAGGWVLGGAKSVTPETPQGLGSVTAGSTSWAACWTRYRNVPVLGQ